MMRKVVTLVVGLGLLAGDSGCGVPWKSRSTLPERNWLVRDQLIIHSEFPVAAHHRIWDDLTTLRVELSQRLSLPVSDEPIHVYLFEDEGCFREMMRARYPDFVGRRALFVETDTRLEAYALWGDRVAEDLRHEITHGYLHAVLPNLPLWLDEGLAEYFEVARGNHGVNRTHLIQLASRLESDAFAPSIPRLESLGPNRDMSAEDYAEAWAWVHFLLETGPGRQKLLSDYLQRLREPGSAPPLSVAFREQIAEPERELAGHVCRLTGRTHGPGSKPDAAGEAPATSRR